MLLKWLAQHFFANGGAVREGLRKQPRILAYPASPLQSSPPSGHAQQNQTASIRSTAIAPTPPLLHNPQEAWVTSERPTGSHPPLKAKLLANSLDGLIISARCFRGLRPHTLLE